MKKINLIILALLTVISSAYSQLPGTSSRIGSLAEQAASISVTIGGPFIQNGSFAASPNERVDQFITRIYTAAKAEYSKLQVEKKKYDYYVNLNEEDRFSKRNIRLKRANGEELRIDLEKFRLTGDFKYNPYLKNDDVLIFINSDIERNFVTISGAVNSIVKFEYLEGDNLSDALLFAGGINSAYENVKSVEVIRLSYDGLKEDVLIKEIKSDFPLKRGDRIRVIAEETQRKDFKAGIYGEVLKPGSINIPKDGLRLKDFLLRAGGFRENADLSRAELIRGSNVFKSLFFSEEAELLLMRRMANIKTEDSLTFMVDNKLRFSRGSGLIDFEELKDDSSNASNFIVKDGDFVFVPEKQELVYVFGQVKSFGFIEFRKGQDYNYYINKAGGIGESAKDEIYVIKGKTRTWILASENNVQVEPGDYIWIPKKYPKDFDYYLQRVAYMGSIITGIVSIALLIIQVMK